MSEITPALSHAFSLLRNDLYLHLDEAEFLTLLDEEWEQDDIESGRKLIRDLTEVIRRVVAEHEEVPLGGCRFCKQTSWPCPTVETIHSVLRSPEREFVRLVAVAQQ